MFNKKNNYVPLKAEVEKMIESVVSLLKKYNHVKALDTCRGIFKMFGEDGIFWANKGWIIDAMTKCPEYNGNLQIVMPYPMVRHVDFTVIQDFMGWFEWHCGSKVYTDMMVEVLKPFLISRNEIHKIESIEKWEEENCALTAERAVELNEYGKQYDVDLHLNKGMKISKIVRKLCVMAKVNDIVNIQAFSFYDQNGNYHVRRKDMGYNHWIASVGDAVNPYKKMTVAVLSANPIDYYTMSFGDDWTSCHSIDKEDIRCTRDGAHEYSGLYCAGTESYVLDGSTLIFYLLNKEKHRDIDINHPENYDKYKRAVVYVGEDKFIFSRLYPDGRDGGDDKFLPMEIMSTLEGLFNQMSGTENNWVRSEGIASTLIETEPRSNHYRDYQEDNDVYTSFECKDNKISHKKIKVGHKTICPECGDTHDSSDYLRCYDCREEKKHCAGCGRIVRRSRALISDSGKWFCDECGVVCENCGTVVPAHNSFTSDDGFTLCGLCFESSCHHTKDGYEVLRERNLVYTPKGIYYRGMWRGEEPRRCPHCRRFVTEMDVHVSTNHPFSDLENM